jgi:hypothetical protein
MHLLQIDIVAVLPDAVALYDPRWQQDRNFSFQRALRRVLALQQTTTSSSLTKYFAPPWFSATRWVTRSERADARRAEFNCELEQCWLRRVRLDASTPLRKRTDLVEDTGGTDDDVLKRTTRATAHDRVVAADYLAVFCPAASGLWRRARTGHCVLVVVAHLGPERVSKINRIVRKAHLFRFIPSPVHHRNTNRSLSERRRQKRAGKMAAVNYSRHVDSDSDW